MATVQYKNFTYLKGPKGDQGPRGVQGDRGPKGDRGEKGEQGPAAEPVSAANVRPFFSGVSPIAYSTETGQISLDAQYVAQGDTIDGGDF